MTSSHQPGPTAPPRVTQEPGWCHRLLAVIYAPVMHVRNRLRHLAGQKSIGVAALIHRGAPGDTTTTVLLVRHSYRPGWCLPGGGLKRGETPLAAITRELSEEVGLSLTTRPVLFQIYHQPWFGMSDYPILYIIDGEASFDQTPHIADPLELLEIRWFALGDLPADIAAATRSRIAEWRGLQPIADDWS